MNTRVFKIFKGQVFISSSVTAFLKRSQARSSFSIVFEETFSEGWDEVDTVILDGGVWDEMVSTRVDESTSNTWAGWWDEGRLGLTTWDEPCLVFLPHRLGRFSKSKFLDKVFLLSPADGWAWDSTSRRAPSPVTSFPLFPFTVAIPKKKKRGEEVSFL